MSRTIKAKFVRYGNQRKVVARLKILQRKMNRMRIKSEIKKELNANS